MMSIFTFWTLSHRIAPCYGQLCLWDYMAPKLTPWHTPWHYYVISPFPFSSSLPTRSFPRPTITHRTIRRVAGSKKKALMISGYRWVCRLKFYVWINKLICCMSLLLNICIWQKLRFNKTHSPINWCSPRFYIQKLIFIFALGAPLATRQHKIILILNCLCLNKMDDENWT